MAMNPQDFIRVRQEVLTFQATMANALTAEAQRLEAANAEWDKRQSIEQRTADLDQREAGLDAKIAEAKAIREEGSAAVAKAQKVVSDADGNWKKLTADLSKRELALSNLRTELSVRERAVAEAQAKLETATAAHRATYNDTMAQIRSREAAVHAREDAMAQLQAKIAEVQRG